MPLLNSTRRHPGSSGRGRIPSSTSSLLLKFVIIAGFLLAVEVVLFFSNEHTSGKKIGFGGPQRVMTEYVHPPETGDQSTTYGLSSSHQNSIQAALDDAFTTWGNSTLSRRFNPPSASGGVDTSALQPNGRSLYHSLGQVKEWVGNIDSLTDCRDAFSARSYRGELIIQMADVQHADQLFNHLLNLEDLGFGHHLVLAPDAGNCMVLERYWPGIGCIWSDFMGNGTEIDSHPLWHRLRRQLVMRWMVVSRAIKLQYNVLQLDTDTHMAADPYAFLKFQYFRSATLQYTPTYWGFAPGINCGQLYIQGARANGAVAWMAYEVARRTLTWMEDTQALLKANPQLENDEEFLDTHVMDEQTIFNDAACSAMHGMLTFFTSLSPRREYHPHPGDRAKHPFTKYWKQFHAMCGPPQTLQTLVYPPSWRAVTRTKREQVRVATLRVPVVNESHFVDAGVHPYPFKMNGKYVRELDQWLGNHGPHFRGIDFLTKSARKSYCMQNYKVRKDVEGCMQYISQQGTMGTWFKQYLSRMFVSLSPSSKQTQKEEEIRRERRTLELGVPQIVGQNGGRWSGFDESMMESPWWLFGRWQDSGSAGAWRVRTGQPARLVVGHLMVTKQLTDRMGQFLAYKIYGWWHYQVDWVLRGPNLIRSVEHEGDALAEVGVVEQVLGVDGPEWRWGRGQIMDGVDADVEQVPGTSKMQFRAAASTYIAHDVKRRAAWDRGLFRDPNRQYTQFIAMAPRANLFFESWNDYLRTAQNLAKLAAMSSRQPVWPLIDCRSPIIKSTKDWVPSAAQPLPFNDKVILPFGPDTDVKCLVIPMLSRNCSHVSIMHDDFEAVVWSLLNDTAAPRSQSTPPEHMLLKQAYQPLAAVDFSSINKTSDELDQKATLQTLMSSGSGQQFTFVEAHEMEHELLRMSKRRVVYLGARAQVQNYGAIRFNVLEQNILKYCAKHGMIGAWGSMWRPEFDLESDGPFQYPTWTQHVVATT